VSLWDATQGLLDALFIAGLAVLPIGLIVLGIAMLEAPAFGPGVGRLSIGLGALGVVAAVVLLIEPESDVAFVGVFALIVFHLVLGWRVLGLSGEPSGATHFGRTR
jgi:membrane protein implicated in regulation of membrane protease activity